MRFANLDLVVRDVPAATVFFRDVVGLIPRVSDERFAELAAGAVTIVLTPEAMVPIKPAQGVILHFQVDDIQEALQQARRHGAEVLLEPTCTDWGWESAMIADAEEIVVGFHRHVTPHGVVRHR